MEDLMKMMCCLVTRTTDDPEDLVPFKKVFKKFGHDEKFGVQ